MRWILLFAAFSLAASAQNPPTQAPAAQDAPPPTIEKLMADANTRYMKRDYAASVQLYEQARAQIEETPAGNPQRFDVMKRLSTVAAAAGNYPASNTYLAAAIAWRTERFGDSDPQVMAERLHQVGIYRAMGDAAGAREALTAIIAKHEEMGGRRNPDLANDHSLMGQIDLDVHQKKNAMQEFQLAILLRSISAGPLDVTQVPDLDRLGTLCIDKEILDYRQAEDVFRRALIIRESVLGAEHADLLATLDGLAYAYFGQQKYPEAEAAYQRLLALWTKSVGETHPMLAVALDKLAVFYAAQKRHEEARAAYERANAIRALVFAQGLVKEADDARTNTDPPAVSGALYQRALHALEPSNPLYDPLHDAINEVLQPAEPAADAKKAAKTAPKK